MLSAGVKVYFVLSFTLSFTFTPYIYTQSGNLTAVLCYSNTGLIVDLNALCSRC